MHAHYIGEAECGCKKRAAEPDVLMLRIKSQYSETAVQVGRFSGRVHPPQIHIAAHAQTILGLRAGRPKHQADGTERTPPAHQYSQSRRRGLGSGWARSA